MKILKIIIGCLVAPAFACLVFSGDSHASSSVPAPGSAADPLVSKSYVDDKISKLTELISGGQTDTQEPVVQNGTQGFDADAVVEEVLRRMEASEGNRFVPVQINENEILFGGEGTEIILRSGTAAAYCLGPDGLSDITGGGDVIHGSPIEKNHLLIVPRADGRGIITLGESWFLIKGSYSVVPQTR